MKLEDHLSQLPDDCLLDVLPRLNHNDLDEASTLSYKMRNLSDLSRTRATKVYAPELRVIQSEERKDRPQTQIISEIVANRLITIVDRFAFERALFEFVSFDKHFVRFVEYISTSNSLQIFCANKCTMDENITPEGRTRFLSTLLSIKPRFLYLWCRSLFINELFIKEYADAAPFAKFFHYDLDSVRFMSEENFKETLEIFDVTHMVVDVIGLMPMILKRLHQKIEGLWWFVLTRQFTQDDIETDFPSDIQHTFSLSDDGNAVFTLEIIGTIHKAIICPMQFPNSASCTLKMNSSFKRRNEEDSQLFCNSKTIKLEDHLSQLPDDCLLDILPRLNHDDLDEVSTLSYKMRILSDLSRTRAAKSYTNELRVIQVTNEQFIIEIYTEEDIYFIDKSNHYDISERMKLCTARHEFSLTGDRPQTQIISDIVANRIIALGDRFDFGITTFEGLSIDNHIVRCIEQLSTSRSIWRVGMNECAVDDKLSPEGRTRFLSTLLAIKPASLFLWCDSICIDDLFIKEYADTVPSADFYFCDEDDFAIIEPDENIWKFKTLGIAHMVVEVHWILPQIWKRLHENMDGTWWFSLRRPLTLDDIENYLPTDVQKTFWISDRGEVIFIIEIVETIHKAFLCPIYEPISNRPEWTLKVHFFSFNSFIF